MVSSSSVRSSFQETSVKPLFSPRESFWDGRRLLTVLRRRVADHPIVLDKIQSGQFAKLRRESGGTNRLWQAYQRPLRILSNDRTTLIEDTDDWRLMALAGLQFLSNENIGAWMMDASRRLVVVWSVKESEAGGEVERQDILSLGVMRFSHHQRVPILGQLGRSFEEPLLEVEFFDGKLWKEDGKKIFEFLSSKTHQISVSEGLQKREASEHSFAGGVFREATILMRETPDLMSRYLNDLNFKVHSMSRDLIERDRSHLPKRTQLLISFIDRASRLRKTSQWLAAVRVMELGLEDIEEDSFYIQLKFIGKNLELFIERMSPILLSLKRINAYLRSDPIQKWGDLEGCYDQLERSCGPSG